jgi:hypothetical protein
MISSTLATTVATLQDFKIVSCVDELYKNGFHATTLTGPKEQLEQLRLAIIKLTGINTDWHYYGGRAIFYTEDGIQALSLREFLRYNLEVLVTIHIPEDSSFNIKQLGDLSIAQTTYYCPIRVYDQDNSYSCSQFNRRNIAEVFSFKISIDDYLTNIHPICEYYNGGDFFADRMISFPGMDKLRLIQDHFGINQSY